ncbi:MAG: bifunctional enoyl-CoA hydratase/phosphate acetyltransferase, partial [Bacteroidetes bacterium]|nr:bifunctional enoyl-CoA hydratase/phosphate acetyltransferase [Bacteroidota bacterium]
AEDDHVLNAINEARKNKIANPIFVGNTEKIKKIASEQNIDISGINIIEECNPALAARKAVELVNSGEAQILMKGLVSTADFLRAVLNKEVGLRTNNLLSHIGLFELPAYHKILGLTDAAQNVAPTFEEKVSILKNSVTCLNRLGIENPKVGVLAAVEVVNPKMEPTIHAAMLTQMYRRGQIKNCIIDGPFALDNIISKEACEHKGIQTEVGGDADLIFCPNIEVGNALYKSFTYLAKGTIAAMILGAKAPIVLTSRADSNRSKFMSIALAAAY